MIKALLCKIDIHSKKTCIYTKIIMMESAVTEIWTKTTFSLMAVSICLFTTKQKHNLYWNGLIWFFSPQHRGRHQNYFDTIHSDWDIDKARFFVMSALICILGGSLKDDRVASFRFLKSTPRRCRNSKKTLYDGIARFSKNLGFGNWTSVLVTW